MGKLSLAPLVLAAGMAVVPGSGTTAQTLERRWVARFNGPGNSNDYAFGLAIDSSGSVHVTGSSFTGMTTREDFLTIKYDFLGNQLWTAYYSGPGDGSDLASAICVDYGLNVYVTGRSWGAGTDNYDYATVKYDSEGKELWSARYSAGPYSDLDSSRAIAMDGPGNVCVTGRVGNDPQTDYGTIEYGPTGNQIWFSGYDGPSNSSEEATAICVGPLGDIYVTGSSFNVGTDYDYATVKYDSSGNQLWVARYNGPANGADYANAICVDSSGNVYVTGSSMGIGTDNDYATVKYDPDGDQVWAVRYNSSTNGYDSAKAMFLEGSYVYVTGVSSGTGGFDLVTIKYRLDGSQVWAATYKMGNDPIIAVKDGYVYVAGTATTGGQNCLVVGYDKNGDEFWEDRYDGPAAREDYLRAIAAFNAFTVYVTGTSRGASSLNDAVTIKYSLAVPKDLSCTADGVRVSLDWTNGYAYHSIEIARDGGLIASLPGDATSYEETLRPHIYSRHYEVRGVYQGISTDPASCDVLVDLPPPVDLSCEPEGTTVHLSWTNGYDYGSMGVFRDGGKIATLTGHPTSFDDTVPKSGTYIYRVVGSIIIVVQGPEGPDLVLMEVSSEECASRGIIVLELGVPVQVNLTGSVPSQLLKLEGAAGGPVLVTATDPDAADSNALYLRWDDLPSPSLFDQAAAARGQASQRLAIPHFRDQTAFFLLQAIEIGGGSNEVTVLAAQVPLAIAGISSRFACRGLAQPLSAAVTGAGFVPETAFSLSHRSLGTSIATSRRTYVSSERAEVEFQLGEAPAGAYDLLAENPGGASATLESAFEILDTRRGPVLIASLSAPDRCRYDRLSRVTLRYENAGDEEMAAPLFKLVSLSPETELRLEAEAEFQGSAIQALGIDPSGVAGKLSPGRCGEIPIVFRSREDVEARFELYLFTPNRDDAVGWETIGAPEGMDPPDWEALWPPLSARLGGSWVAYREGLAEQATRLSRRGAPSASARDLLRFAAREALGRPSSAIAGRAWDSSSLAPLAGATVVALDGEVAATSATTDRNGFYCLDWLEGGASYDIRMKDHDPGALQMEMPHSGDALGVDLFAAAGANGLAPGCANCDENGLPSQPLLPPEILFTKIFDSAVAMVSSIDPNEKDGPVGQDGDIGPEEEVLYTVYFENLSTATAWAENVVVEDRLKPEFDWTSFRLRDIQVGGGEIFSAGSAEDPWGSQPGSDGYGGCQILESMGQSGQWILRVASEIDPMTGLARWTFETLDPQTGLPPDPALYPEAGFLPPDDPEDADHRGEGHVDFTVKPKSGIEEGTEIANEATIAFDTRDPVTTNTWRNRIVLNLPVEAPYNPYPRDGTEHPVETDTFLSWQSSAETFDVYLGLLGVDPPIVASRIHERYFRPPELLGNGTVYLWRIVARNAGGEIEGPLWTFKTVDPQPAPGKPDNLSPASGARDVPRRPLFLWSQAPWAAYYEIYLWSHGKPRPDLPVATPARCEFVPVADLDFEKEYDWQVLAVNRIGKSEGDAWTFRTVLESPLYMRGDVNADGEVDLSDAIFSLFFLFLGDREPQCIKSMDIDGNGQKDVTDVIRLLSFLFLGGPAPPEPFSDCGHDSGGDELGCLSHPPCNP